MTPVRKKPGRLDRIRLWTLGALVALLAAHMAAWYFLGWRAIGKLSFSGLASLLVGHVNAAAVFCLTLGVALLFTGRLFCGWACKLSAFQDLAEAIYRRVGFRPRFIHTRARAVRLFIFVPYFLPVLYTWRDVGLSTAYVNLGAVQPWTADLPKTALATVFYFVSITFVLTAAFGRRAFCRLVCPFALFFQLFEALPWIPRIRQRGRCIDCDVCEQACPMGIAVASEIQRTGAVQDAECIRCMVCVDVCPVKALRFGLPGAAAPVQRPDLAPVVRESAFSPGFDAALATLAVIGGTWTATRISGFHIFLGASWGLIAGLLARSAWMSWRQRSEATCSK